MCPRVRGHLKLSGRGWESRFLNRQSAIRLIGTCAIVRRGVGHLWGDPPKKMRWENVTGRPSRAHFKQFRITPEGVVHRLCEMEGVRAGRMRVRKLEKTIGHLEGILLYLRDTLTRQPKVGSVCGLSN